MMIAIFYDAAAASELMRIWLLCHYQSDERVPRARRISLEH